MTDYRTRLVEVVHGKPLSRVYCLSDATLIADLRSLLSEADPWGFLAAHPALSLQAVESDIEGEPMEWAVYRESGSRNDREFTRVSQAATPLDALRAAMAKEA